MNICPYCEKQFTLKKNLYVHLRRTHKLDPEICTNGQRQNNLICNFCSRTLNTYSNLRDHLVGEHNCDLFKETISFHSEIEFLSWKEEKEKEMKCLYVKQTGTKRVRCSKKSYYICHRSNVQPLNKSNSEETNTRKSKSRGSVKLNYSCPSTLDVVEVDGKFKVTLFTPHLGHGPSLTHLNLTKTKFTRLAGNLTKSVRNSINPENIEKQFLLHQQYHHSDAISVDLWVKHMETMGNDCPVLLYKRQGIIHPQVNFLDEKDFFLAIMTNFQKSLLRKFGDKNICVDPTHGNTIFNFLLTTVLIIDEFGEGVPVAFLLSNKANTSSTIMFFFELLKNKVGVIETDTFMSDDAPEFIDSWTTVMGPPKHHLLCSWHVDKHWRTQLSEKVCDAECKALIYKSIRVLLEIQDEEIFNEMLNQTLGNFFSSESTREFALYFQEYYADRSQLWAFCFRKGLTINTNIYLESMHKVLEHIHSCGQKNERVDKCIFTLMNLIRDNIFKRLKRTVNAKPSYRIKLLNTNHLKGKGISPSDITAISDISWTVNSNSNDTGYTVFKISGSCDSNCELFCEHCNVCVHMFSCTCLDNFIKGILCKHIHAVCIKPKLLAVGPLKKTITEEENQLTDFVVHQHQSDDVEDPTIRIKMLDTYDIIARHTVNEETSLQLEKMIDSAVNVTNSASTPLRTTLSKPTNGNVNEQVRLETTKPKFSTDESSLKNPSLNHLSSVSTINMEHCYFKNQ